MSPRNVSIVILAMSVSFCAIFLMLNYLVDSPRDRDLGRLPRWRPPPVNDDAPLRRPATAAQRSKPPRRPTGDRRSAGVATGSGVGKTSSLQTSTAPVDSAVAAASSAAAQEIALLRKDLRHQVAALKKSRDNMLDDLAVELTAMSSERATREVRLLDDESAALVLARLPAAQRQAVLNSLDRKRARILDRKARTWAAK